MNTKQFPAKGCPDYRWPDNIDEVNITRWVR